MTQVSSSSGPKALEAPFLRLPAGTRFGHRTGFGFHPKPKFLVEVSDTIELQAGLHLLVAPNGAGKTTLLRTLARLQPVLQGTPEILGRVHYVSDQLQMDGELSARTLFRAWFDGAALDYAIQLADRLSLNVGTQIQQLSRGNRQKVVLIVAETLAACSGPSLLLLDEPLTGMDAATRTLVTELWASSGESILRLVVLHELEAVKKADSLCTVIEGRLRHSAEQVGQSWLETCEFLRTQ